MIKFEAMERRQAGINALLEQHNLTSLEQAQSLVMEYGVDVYSIVRDIQPICFENARWAYVLGAAVAIQKKQYAASDIALSLGEGLQAFCIPGSVADHRQVGFGHGKLASRLLHEDTRCFAFLAGHESFAAAEGAIGIVQSANKVRQNPLQVILNGLGKDAAYIISRINGFSYVKTEYDHKNRTLTVIDTIPFSKSIRLQVSCYGADDVEEGIQIFIDAGVDVAITGNSTNMTRFQHPVLGTYKKWCQDNGKHCFAVASGGGTGRTVHPDDNGAGPASYGLTDTTGRMYADAQFAGSSSVPAHVEMMGFLGMGNNPMVGASVATAVAIAQIKQH